MAVNPNWPLIVAQVAFNAGFATTSPPSWTDMSTRMWGFNTERGRQYELDQNQTGEASIVFADKDEVLNPANPNPGAPYAGNILPYRPILLQAQWPPVPVGAAVNLLNSAAQAPGPYDPSFESYSAGASVPWITGVGMSAPVVGTTTPHGGTKDVTYSVVVANGGEPMGASWQVPCIPGQQYTSSAYVQQSSASIQKIQVADQNQVLDRFQRTVANSWGTADLGGAWTISQDAGTTADYAVAGGTATMSNVGTSGRHRIFGGPSIVDSDQHVTTSTPVVAAGAPIESAILARYTDANNTYYGGVWFNTDGSVTGLIVKRVAGVQTTLASGTITGLTYVAGMQLRLRFTVVGNALSLKVWPAFAAEPTLYPVTAADNALTSGQVGFTTVLNGGNTNTAPFPISYVDYACVGSVVGSSTSTTGAYVRLTVTWTATQPLHTIQLVTSTTVVAGTVLLDDVQHEPGASASTATTSGPVIYGVHRGFVERWPSKWNYKGMYGYAELTTVDAFAALAAAKLHAAYRAAVMSLNPQLYWPLAEPSGATTFAEVSGNNGPSLVVHPSRYGAGTAPSAGQTSNVPGDPGGVGVNFTPDTNAGSPTTQSSILGTGPLAHGTTPVSLPPTIPSSGWGLTVALWVSAVPDAASSALFGTTLLNLITAPFPYQTIIPIQIICNGSIAAVKTSNDSTSASFNWETIAGPNPLDGKPHLIVASASQDASNLNQLISVDGDGPVPGQVTNATVNGMLQQSAHTVEVAGYDEGNSFEGVVKGLITHVAIWNRVLTVDEYAKLWSAGKGFVGETSGARINRYLTEAGYQGRTSVDTGQSVMGVDVAAEQVSVLDAGQAVTTTENGNLWVNGSGTVTFTSRTRRYTSITAKWSFGEQETPYGEDIAFDFDPQLVYNDITVTNAGGRKPVAGDAASQASYGTRSFTRNVNVRDDNEATDAGNWILRTHKDAHQRIATLTIDPASNPSMWPVALGVEIGDRVTVKRRTAAFTMTADYFIEKVSVTESPTEWTVALEMSPASLWLTPWLLDDATYSVLGSTTALGY